MQKERIPIAKEGYPFIAFSAFLSLICAILGLSLVTLCLVLISTFILMFFRDPERMVPAIERGVISPADGKIIVIEKTRDERFSEHEMMKISIFMNVFNVHVNRIPFSGKVQHIQYVAGAFLAADSAKAHLNNEYCAVNIETAGGQQLTMVQIAGLVARRIICRLERGDSVTVGERFGLIRFGSRVDLYLPTGSNPTVKVGDKVRAGESLLAYLG
ncbi:MAG: phosphatidylserine decarboxylase family protein [Desulfocapsaceae bacterium]